jgi:hypothetical protein
MAHTSCRETGSTVPDVDFNALCAGITMEQVLDAFGVPALGRRGEQCYGACPLHESAPRCSRCFSVNAATDRYYRHGCQSHGNPVDLWTTATKLPQHQTAINLCQRLGREVPWIRRW